MPNVPAGAAIYDAVPSPSPAAIPPLPPVGNLGVQMQQAQAIATQAKAAMALLQSGDNPVGALSGLVGAGVTMAVGQTPSAVGQVIRTIVTIGAATASGAAVGGPFGAAAGLIVSSITALVGGSPPVFEGLDASTISSPGGLHLYGLVYQWAAANGSLTSGDPQGGSFASYLMLTYPPSKTRRPELLWFLANMSGGSDYGMAAVNAGSSEAIGNPMDAAWPPPSTGMSTFIGACMSIVPSLLWHWSQPSTGATSNTPGAYAAAYPVWEEAPSTAAWQGDTIAILPKHGKPGMTSAQIMASALARRPDPLYFCSDLYVQNWLSAGADGIYIQNGETLSGLAAVLGLLAVGASTRAIVSELVQQQNNLATLNATGQVPFTISLQEWTADGKSAESWKQAKAASTMPVIPPLFRQLVEDYVALANAEATNPHVTMDQVVAARAKAPPAFILDVLRASGTTSYGGVRLLHPHAPAPAPAPAPGSPAAHHAAVAASAAKVAAGRVVSSFLKLYLG